MPIAPFWWLTTVSLHDELKTEPGGERIDVVQIDLGQCNRVFGVAPCTATGTPCVNSWESCVDPVNYDETGNSLTVSLCNPVSDLPVGWGLIPLLKSDPSFDPGDVTPDDGIGKVGSVSISCMDAPSDDIGLDPYVSTRPFDPLTRGSFWSKMRARWPHYQGRTLRWYTGYNHRPLDLSNLLLRTYQVESLTGFGTARGVSIKAKDPLKLADDKRSSFPQKSSGKLAVGILATGGVTQVDITTAAPAEYSLYAFETASAVRLKGEIFAYTGTTPIAGGVRLTGVTRGVLGPYTTPAEAHAIGDEVQKCAWWDDMLPPNVLRWLLVLGSSVPPVFIDYASWESLYQFWLGSQTLTRLVTEPEGVNSQISDILLQSSSWGLWWDEVAQEIGYEVFRPAAEGEIVHSITDPVNIVNESLVLDDNPDRLVNDCIIRFGQVNPTLKADETTNYRDAVRYIDQDSVSVKEVGSFRTKVINGVWHAATPLQTARRIAQRIVTSRGSLPFKVTLKVARKDDDIKTGDFIDLTTQALTGLLGEPRTLRMRVVATDQGGDTVTLSALQDFVSTRYALIAPTSASGVSWATASGEQRTRYMFIANNSGVYSDGQTGKRIF